MIERVTTASIISASILLVLFSPACERGETPTRGDGVDSATEKEEAFIKVGVILPLTGSAASYGQNAKNGIELALEEINAKGGVNGVSLRILYKDSETDPKKALSALQELYDEDGIRYVIGDINSNSLLAMAPMANENKVLLLSPGASDPRISNMGEYVFRNWPSASFEGQIGAQQAYNVLDWRKAAVLYVNRDYGAELAETFRDEFQNLGGEVVAYETYPKSATGMSDLISEIVTAAPDGIYLLGWPKEMAVALKQLKEQEANLPIVSAQSFDDSPSIIELAGDAAEGALFSVPRNPDREDPVVESFAERYEAQYGEKPGICSAAGYDALQIYAHAIDKIGDSPEKVREVLTALKDFPGADGPITFDEHGDLMKPFMFRKVEKGSFASVN